MKVQVMHYTGFRYRAPEGEESFTDCLVFYYSYEKGDTVTAVEELAALTETYQGPPVRLLFPFAHLTDQQLNVHKARSLDTHLRTLAKHPVAPFGVPKGITLEAPLGTPHQHFWTLPQYVPVTTSSHLSVVGGAQDLYQELQKVESLTRPPLEGIPAWDQEVSESGQFLYGPELTTLLEAVTDYLVNKALELPFRVDYVQGSEWFNVANASVNQHLLEFGGGDDSYFIQTPTGRYVARHAGCYQAFTYLSRRRLFPEETPYGVVEVVNCYRRERKGEISPLYRSTRFTLVDLHVLVTPGGLEETFRVLLERIEEIRKDVGLPEYRALVTYSAGTWREQYSSLVTRAFPDHVEEVREKEGGTYWVFNIELHVRAAGTGTRYIELATIQLDHQNPSRFGIRGLREQGPYWALHVALLGSTDRAAYALLQYGVPLHLAPEQVRVVVTKDTPLGALPERVTQSRHTIDTRRSSHSRRLRQAFNENVPVILLSTGDTWSVIRSPSGRVEGITLEALISLAETWDLRATPRVVRLEKN